MATMRLFRTSAHFKLRCVITTVYSYTFFAFLVLYIYYFLDCKLNAFDMSEIKRLLTYLHLRTATSLNSLDKASNTMINSNGLRTEP